MAEIGESLPRSIPRFAADAQRKVTVSKTAPSSQYPVRQTTCIGLDQQAALKQIRLLYRCSESFAVRLCIDTFCRTQGIPLSNNNNGAPNVQR